MTGASDRGFAIVAGLDDALRPQAARLYWQAFGGKLGRVLGPETRAIAFLLRAMRGDHALCAVAPGGRLLGIAGFKTHRGSFAGGGLPELMAVYGRAGGLWRAGLLALLSREVENRRFLMDGLCVDTAARGQGVGRALLAAIAAEAARRGYAEVRLDVIDSNLRARALYEREGFVAVGGQRIGLLRHVFGFAEAITMVRPSAPAQGGPR